MRRYEHKRYLLKIDDEKKQIGVLYMRVQKRELKRRMYLSRGEVTLHQNDETEREAPMAPSKISPAPTTLDWLCMSPRCWVPLLNLYQLTALWT